MNLQFLEDRRFLFRILLYCFCIEDPQFLKLYEDFMNNLPWIPNFLLNKGSFIKNINLEAIASGSLGGTKNPVLLWIITSDNPPISDAITGISQDEASIAATQKVSDGEIEGTTKISIIWRYLTTSLLSTFPTNLTESVRARDSVNSSKFFLRLPSPTIRRLDS